MTFQLPSFEKMSKLEETERKNLFRRFFAASRYDRLLIQQTLVKSVFEPELQGKIRKMEAEQSKNFYSMLEQLSKSLYSEEFIAAAREEDAALQQIIEAYDKRMAAAK